VSSRIVAIRLVLAIEDDRNRIRALVAERRALSARLADIDTILAGTAAEKAPVNVHRRPVDVEGEPGEAEMSEAEGIVAEGNE
jgi:hypothetical protein